MANRNSNRSLPSAALLLAFALAPQHLIGADPIFTHQDAGESGAFNFGPSEATVSARAVEKLKPGLQLDYSVGKDAGVGIWTKNYPGELSRDTVDVIRIGVRLAQESQAREIAVKAEVKGTDETQLIELRSEAGWHETDVPIEWDRIGELNEVVLVVTRAGGAENVTGWLLLGISFEKLSFWDQHASSVVSRIIAVALISAVAMLLWLLLSGLLPQIQTRISIGGLRRDFTFALATVLVAGIALAIFWLGDAAYPGGWHCLIIGLLGGVVGETLKFGLTGRHLSPLELFVNVFVTGVLAATATSMSLLQTPTSGVEILKLCSFTSATFAVLFHLSHEGYDLTRRAYDHREPCGRAVFVVDGQSRWPVLGNFPTESFTKSAFTKTDSSLEITNTTGDIQTTINISLPDEDDAVEVWEVTVGNLSDQARDVKVVPYLEWVINDPGGDRGHTQYNRLFPEISYDNGANTLLALHRYTKLYGFIASDVAPQGFLTSRLDFIGRAQSLWTPRVLETMAFHEPKDVDFSVDGTATFHMQRDSLSSELTVFVPRTDPVGIYRLTVRNHGDAPRRLRFAPYFQIALADMPENAGPLNIRHDKTTDAVYFQNPRNTFRPGVAFAATTAAAEFVETQRGRFHGPDAAIAHPEIVKTGTPAADESDRAPIAGFVSTLEVPPGGEVTVAVMLGQADDRNTAEAVVSKYQNLQAVETALEENRKWWSQLISTSQIETSNAEFDQVQNWLKYQAIAERIWARRGFYQASGAFGFRDQLQDSVNMIWVDPAFARNQIKLHAAQQFLEGDVVHWFFRLQDGRTGFACRSHAYDNLLWLSWSVVEYVRMTGDETLLDEVVPYLRAELPLEPLPKGKHGMGFFPHRAATQESVYKHCLRAYDLVFDHRLGPNGLPLIDAGDWNDGSDEIGSEGRGESTWLGFFMVYSMSQFVDIIEKREGKERRTQYEKKLNALREAIEKTWRGDRYLRAIHDDGTEIGVKGSGIWEIDALTAAWSVMSGVNPQRSRICFDTAVAELERDNVVLLGHPALREDTKPYLGRSSRYPEGVRENGMYCHGDQWLVRAARLLSEQCCNAGNHQAAAKYRETGYRIWQKISPLLHVTPREIETYGGQPNKQAADILTTFDPGRMIWNGYTGAAGWMHRQAFEGVLGATLVNNKLVVPDDFSEPRGDLILRGVSRDLSDSPFNNGRRT